MPYDEFGRTPEMAEEDRRCNRIGCAVVATFMAWIVMMLSLGACTAEGAKPTHPVSDSLSHTYTADGDVIKVYVVTDSDTGIQYIVSDHGGITPRLGMD